jgi:hypothetical protein
LPGGHSDNRWVILLQVRIVGHRRALFGEHLWRLVMKEHAFVLSGPLPYQYFV